MINLTVCTCGEQTRILNFDTSSLVKIYRDDVKLNLQLSNKTVTNGMRQACGLHSVLRALFQSCDPTQQDRLAADVCCMTRYQVLVQLLPHQSPS